MSQNAFDLDQLRDEYLDNIEEDLSILENHTIKLEESTGEALEAELYKIFRIVHSVKGSAGSFEFYGLANIFHHFEDFINIKMEKPEVQEKIDLFLKFIDLARRCLQDYRDNTHELKIYSDQIDQLTRNKNAAKYKLLLVEPTKSIQKIFEKVGSKYKVNVISLTNGATAMNRVLTEKFDIIVSSLNVEILDGKSLLNAIRVMDCINNEVPLLLITSDESNLNSNSHYDCINKDHSLLKNIESFIQSKLNKNAPKQSEKKTPFPFENVFCCEDDKMVQMIIKKPFSEKNINLNIVIDKNTAMNFLENNTPDLILLDYFLMGNTGEDIVNEIIKLIHLKDIPIIFMTSSPEKLDLKSMSKLANIKGILEKPLNGASLLEEIRRIAVS